MAPEDEPEELIKQASEGDPLAVEELLERYMPGLRAFIRLRAGPVIRAKESASDLAQSVCREILQDLSGFEYRGEASFKHWLYTAALRKILDKNKFYRRDKRDAGREAPAPRGSSAPGSPDFARCYNTFYSPSQDAMAKEELEAIESAFESLPINYQEVITWSRIIGMTHAEIADRLGKTEAYSRNLLSRALARLARVVREQRPPRPE